MREARCSHGAAVLDDRTLVVCGGYERGTCLSSCEMYTNNAWVDMPAMESERGR